MSEPQIATPSSPPMTPESGRGVLIFVFGILSLLMLGPILGIPAWVMGHKDLKKIRAGIIPTSEQSLTKAGMILGIIGTLLYVLILFMIIAAIMIGVGTAMFQAQSEEATKDAIMIDISRIGSNAYEYRTKPKELGGGEGTYIGYKIPAELSKQIAAGVDYSVTVLDADNITIEANAKEFTEPFKATVDANGRTTLIRKP